MPFAKGNNEHQRKKRKSSNPLPRGEYIFGGLAPIGCKTTGRPTVYQDAFPEVVRRLRLLHNATRDEVATFFGVDGITIDLWCDTYPLFNKSYAEGGDLADLSVAEGLKHRALGLTAKNERITYDASGNVVSRTEEHRYIPPDVPAAALWLSNRQRAKWNLKAWSNNVQPGEEGGGASIKIEGGLPDE
jgi:hypothetical protein